MKSTPLLFVAILSVGCFGKVADGGGAPGETTPGGGTVPGETTSGGGTVPGETTPSETTPSETGGTGGAAGTCWQSSPDAPAASGPTGKIASCTLAGTWSYEVTFSAVGQKKMVWSFDDQGRAVGGPAGTDLCKKIPWYGNYTLSDKGFSANSIRGDGAPNCGQRSSTTLAAEFSADCKTLSLPRILTDSCTGGALFYEGKMTRLD